jgi:hypothetical protein
MEPERRCLRATGKFSENRMSDQVPEIDGFRLEKTAELTAR